MEKESLFHRVGGEIGIEKLIRAFYDRVLADEELGPFFAEAPMDHLRTMQKEFFSKALGGPAFYSGMPLAQVHAGRGIESRHMKRFVRHFLETLEAEREDLSLTEQDVKDVYSRVAIEADRVMGGIAESG
jgi:hemoglobin